MWLSDEEHCGGMFWDGIVPKTDLLEGTWPLEQGITLHSKRRG